MADAQAAKNDAAFVEWNGRRVLHFNIAGCPDVDQSIRTGEKAKALILAEPLKSVLLLTDVTDTYFESKATEYMKAFSSAVTPHVKASAMVGVTGLKKVIVTGLALATGRTIKAFDKFDEAKAWLLAQA